MGIPNVIDRWVQQAVLEILEPIFEPTFHSSSHGFRPRRGVHTAIADAKEYAGEGYGVVVDIDLAFDLAGRQVRYPRIQPKRAEPVASVELVKGPDGTAPIVVAHTAEMP